MRYRESATITNLKSCNIPAAQKHFFLFVHPVSYWGSPFGDTLFHPVYSSEYQLTCTYPTRECYIFIHSFITCVRFIQIECTSLLRKLPLWTVALWLWNGKRCWTEAGYTLFFISVYIRNFYNIQKQYFENNCYGLNEPSSV